MPLNTYPTIAAFANSIGQPLRHRMDFSVHRLRDIHGPEAIQSPPFRTDYFAFLLIETGRGQYTVDGMTFDLRPGSFYFTTPGHVKSFRMDEPLRGYLWTFTEAFLQKHYPGRLGLAFPFLFDRTVPVMDLPADVVFTMRSQVESLRLTLVGRGLSKCTPSS